MTEGRARADGGLVSEQKEFRERKKKKKEVGTEKEKNEKLAEQYIKNVPQKKDSVFPKVNNA